MRNSLEHWVKKGGKVEITWDDSIQLFYAELDRINIPDCDFYLCGSGETVSEAVEELCQEVKDFEKVQ